MTREFYDERLYAMLQYRRPHGTLMELDWADTFLGPYAPKLAGNDDTMAYIVEVGEDSKTLFSCHVDTVHRTEGKQKVLYNPKTKSYYKTDGKPLGADDGAGCWLLMEMIDAKIPGVYIFHRGEECGGIGSSWMAKHCPDFLGYFDRAIAFDRKATHSVITHQSWGRCCSEAFALALSDAFNALNDNFMYSPDDGGVYTDTAEYVGLIPECTNVSCGYYNEHTASETLDLEHLFALRDACLKLDWEALPTVRKTGEVETLFFNTPSRYSTGTGKSGMAFEDDMYDVLDEMTYDDMLGAAYNDPDAFVNLVYSAIRGKAPPGPVWGMPDESELEVVPDDPDWIHDVRMKKHLLPN